MQHKFAKKPFALGDARDPIVGERSRKVQILAKMRNLEVSFLSGSIKLWFRSFPLSSVSPVEVKSN